MSTSYQVVVVSAIRILSANAQDERWPTRRGLAIRSILLFGKDSVLNVLCSALMPHDRYIFARLWYGTSRLFARTFSSSNMSSGNRMEIDFREGRRFGNGMRFAAEKAK